MGRTLLIKELGISKIVYFKSSLMLSVPEEIIKLAEEKLFSFFSETKSTK